MTAISLQVSYSQLAVFLSDLENPFNDWSEQHFKQGFAWREGSVSFATLDADGPIDLEIATPPTLPEPRESCERAIVVPFEVRESQRVVVASVMSQEFEFELKRGAHALQFEHGTRDGKMWARLSLSAAPHAVEARILKADAALAPQEPLLMDAVPATS